MLPLLLAREAQQSAKNPINMQLTELAGGDVDLVLEAIRNSPRRETVTKYRHGFLWLRKGERRDWLPYLEDIVDYIVKRRDKPRNRARRPAYYPMGALKPIR